MVRIGELETDGMVFDVYCTASNSMCSYYGIDGPEGWQSFNTGLYNDYLYELVDFISEHIGANPEECRWDGMDYEEVREYDA